jgi:hypothetical protein
MTTNLLQQREHILQQMQAIQRLRRGSFSRQSFPARRRGLRKQGPYFLLQGYADGRKFSERIPAERAEEVQQDVENYRRFQALAEQFVAVSDALTRQSNARGGDAKKNSRLRKSATKNSGNPERC